MDDERIALHTVPPWCELAPHRLPDSTWVTSLDVGVGVMNRGTVRSAIQSGGGGCR